MGVLTLARRLARHAVVGLDTSAFIYLLEDSPQFGDLAKEAFRGLEQGAFRGVTSVLTLMELTVQPLRSGRDEVAREYVEALTSYPNLMLADIDCKGALCAAGLRSRYGLASADALHVATCLENAATAFLTNDLRLKRIAEIDVIALSDFADSA